MTTTETETSAIVQIIDTGTLCVLRRYDTGVVAPWIANASVEASFVGSVPGARLTTQHASIAADMKAPVVVETPSAVYAIDLFDMLAADYESLDSLAHHGVRRIVKGQAALHLR